MSDPTSSDWPFLDVSEHHVPTGELLFVVISFHGAINGMGSARFILAAGFLPSVLAAGADDVADAGAVSAFATATQY